MNGQQLFHSFLPGVTAAVLTTQPAWAGTVKVNGVELASSPSVLTSSYGQTLVGGITNPLLSSTKDNSSQALVPYPDWISLNVKPVNQDKVPVIETGQAGNNRGQILRSNDSSFFNLTSSPYSQQQIDQNRSAPTNQGESNLATSGQKSANIFVPSFDSKPSAIEKTSFSLSASQQPTTQRNNLDSRFQTVAQNTLKDTGTTKLLTMLRCSLPKLAFIQSSTACLQKIGSKELVAQNSPTSPPNTSPKPTAPVTIPVTPGNASPKPTAPVPTPTQPPNASPKPTAPVPIPVTPPNASPAPTGVVSIPQNLKSNPNPLQFPTKPDEVSLQGNQPISLAQALELAKQNNRQLQLAQLELERNQAALREAQAALYPTLGISTNVSRGRSSTSTLSANLEQKAQEDLPPQLRTAQPAEASSSFSGQAQLQYDLFTSGRRQASIKAAEEQVRVSELTVEQQSEEIRLNVSTQYYDLQQADEQVRIAKSAVQNAQASLKDAEALERAGVGTRFDVLRSQVNLANATQDLTNAASQQQIAGRRLAAQLNLPQSVSITAADPVKLAGLWNQSLEQSIVLAFQNRPELQQQLAQRNISEQQRRQALASLGPQISLVASYDILDVFNDTVGFSDGYSFGVRASLNLFDGGLARARAAQAKTNIAIAETQFANNRDQIRFQVEQAFSNQKSNLENVQTANAALEQAREALRLARLRFQAGVGTQTDVINSENDLTRAEGNRIRAILDYNRALANLQRSVTSRALR